MQTLKIEIPHQLGKAEAQRRIAEGLQAFERQSGGISVLGFSSAWAGERLSFSGQVMGQTMSGRIEALDRSVRVELDLPDFFAALGGLLKSRIRRDGAALLEDRTKKP